MINPAILVSTVYMWWLLTTPMFSRPFGFLAEIQFEKILAGLYVIFLLCTFRVGNTFRPYTLLLYCLFVWMYICSFSSIYVDQDFAVEWREKYWKMVVFFVCLTNTFKTTRELYAFLAAIFVIIFSHQLHTWVDFINGGAYVYQQGMKRMISVWSAGGYGAGNAWGYLALFGLPLAFVSVRFANSKFGKFVSVFFLTSTFLCIVFSGVRGALIAGVGYLVIASWNKVPKIRLVLVSSAALLFGFPLLPTDVQNRFQSIVAPKDSSELTGAEKIAASSAEGRLQGLLDGFRIANQSPIFGVGPSSSALAAFELREQAGTDRVNVVIQLHNLYGQIVAELGYPGLLLWVSIYATVFVSVWRANKMRSRFASRESKQLTLIGEVILGWLITMGIYGMAAHTLYDYRWLVAFGLTNAWLAVSESECDNHSLADDLSQSPDSM